MTGKKQKGSAVAFGFIARHRNAAIAVAAGILIPAMFVLAQSAGVAPSASTIVNCAVSGSCSNVFSSAAPASEQSFGANAWEVTRWTSGDFDDDLNVDDALTVGGTVTITGDVTATYLSHVSYTSVVSVTTTQKICALTNNDSTPHILMDYGVKMGTNASGATARVTVTPNFGGAATTGTAGTNLLNDLSWTMSVASTTLSTSSTAGFNFVSAKGGTGEVQRVWDPNESLVFMVASPTTTLTGRCYATWY